MIEPCDSTRRPRFDDEADGLDCFAAEGAASVVVAEADAIAVFAEETLPVRTATLPLSVAVQEFDVRAVMVAPSPVWARRLSKRQVTPVTVLFVLGGVLGMWLDIWREPPKTSVPVASAKPAAPAIPSVEPRPPAAPPAWAAPAAPAATSPANAAPAVRIPVAAVPAAPASHRVAAPPVAILSRPVISPDTARPALLEATPAVRLESPAVTAEPELVTAEPAVAAAPARAAIVTPPSDRVSIERVLAQYRDAYDRLDAPSAAVIWPRVDTRALSRAFSTLSQQDVSFDSCALDIAGASAKARCVGEIRYVPRVGDQVPRVRRLSWAFALERVADRWQIAQVTAD